MPLCITVTRQPDGGQTGTYRYSFHQREVLVGRDQATEVRLPHPSVSLVHLRLVHRDGGWQAVDAGSTNGTYLDGRRLDPGAPVSVTTGSQLQVGPFRLILSFAGGPEGTEQLTAPTDTERFARQMVLELLGALQRGQDHPVLTVRNGPQRGQTLLVPPHGAPLILGRGETCDLTLSDADASRRHLEVRRQGVDVVVQDLGSKNGLEVNGQRAIEPHVCRDGDRLRLGQTELVYHDPAEQYLKELQEIPDSGEQAPTGAGRQRGAQAAPHVAWGAGTWLLAVMVALVVLAAMGAMIYLLL